MLRRIVPFSLIAVAFAQMVGSLGAQQNQGSTQPPASPPPQAPRAVQGAGADLSNAAAVDPKAYQIGPEDLLYVKVWREADFSSQYIVRPDGKITLPLVGDVQASGLTPDKLSGQLAQDLAKFINNPDVSVSVLQVNSKKFYITGQVNKPGEYPLIMPVKVFDALSNAGGFRDFANKKKIIIMRGAERLKFNYQDILKGKNLEQNILLENGDTVVVP